MRISLNKYKIFSNAKINIGLNVFQKESDGYHNIDSIMAPIDLADEMDITFYSDLGDLKIECSDRNIPTDERNILYKTYKAFFEESKKEKRKIDIILKKNIPSEAGLGGGSSNAGFFLKLLNEHYRNIYNESELEELAMKIGSDVPFFIKNKTARVGGKGNKVDLVENNLKDSIILIKPLDFGVSTKEAYESFDNLKEVKYADFDKIIECLKDNNRIALENSIENSLEQGILETDINIKMLKMTLNSVISGKKFFMSGSGSTYYTFVTKVDGDKFDRLRAYVDVTLDDCLVIHGLKLMQGEQGLFVAMPSRKMRNEEFKDIVHPICPELRNDITKVVQEKYFALDQEQEAAV